MIGAMPVVFQNGVLSADPSKRIALCREIVTVRAFRSGRGTGLSHLLGLAAATAVMPIRDASAQPAWRFHDFRASVGGHWRLIRPLMRADDEGNAKWFIHPAI